MVPGVAHPLEGIFQSIVVEADLDVEGHAAPEDLDVAYAERAELVGDPGVAVAFPAHPPMSGLMMTSLASEDRSEEFIFMLISHPFGLLAGLEP